MLRQGLSQGDLSSREIVGHDVSEIGLYAVEDSQFRVRSTTKVLGIKLFPDQGMNGASFILTGPAAYEHSGGTRMSDRWPGVGAINNVLRTRQPFQLYYLTYSASHFTSVDSRRLEPSLA